MQIKKKIVLVKQQESSDWVSCKTITQNLADAYLQRSDIEVIQTLELKNTNSFTAYEAGFLLSKIECDTIIFIDHHPSPASIVSSLDEHTSSQKRADLVFHIFGDFILQAPQWLGATEALKKYKVKFICASKAQGNLLKKLVKDSSLVENSFFPVNTNFFNFNESKRNSTRKKYNIEESDIVLIYTGRLSMQKNVVELIQLLDEVKKVFNLNFKVLVAGPFDDIGVPYLGKYSHAGAYSSRWLRTIEDKTNIKYLGNLTIDELHELYCASDCYISMSTHNDEDFGMAPAEAASCGLPLILSDWGGYSSFKDFFPNCSLVRTSFNTSFSNRAMPDKKDFFRTLTEQLDRLKSIKRETNDAQSVSNFSKALSLFVDFSSTNYFSGFNELMAKTVSRLEATPESPFSGPKNGYSEVYHQLYSSYTGDS
ncbi:glycosyltransferase family 4 protein [Halobacteriovorax sp. HLS]|uniref:glycosyltransferase family 4 protein n=1 Tax=Halobacteriovorax sp. HLS TaxID=2234000 RepID=UPI000FD957F6|nr:glycosyltransferase family 4 protein [Halobacteriovorax sp. HLS]